MKYLLHAFTVVLVLILFSNCSNTPAKKETKQQETVKMSKNQQELNKYAQVKLRADLSHLSSNQKEMLVILFQVADIMDGLFQYEVLPNAADLFNSLTDPHTRGLFEINYGPWNRLAGNTPFVDEVGVKPAGANFYPQDMTKDEFEAWESDEKTSLYTFVRRNRKGELQAVPYHKQFAAELKQASDLLKEAAKLAEDPGFKKYLDLRAEALLTDNYFESDLAWMDMKSNPIDFVVGPIETYEDQLFGYKAAHEAFILIKDLEWSKRLAKYAALLPDLQKGLPVAEAYKAETPGSNSDLNAYDVLYYRGDCNAGSKTIAINLPNDEKVQAEKGSRRLQLKNAMKAKFDLILTPISKQLIAADQQKYVSFDAFFANTMFHEVAHGLGIKETINGKGPVRKALKEEASALEEGKADMLGLYMVLKLIERGEYQGDPKQNMVTFMAGIFRSIRFGSSSAHGKANLVRFNYFKEKGAFSLQDDGTYRVDFEKMEEAMNSLSALILQIQGDGNYEQLKQLMADKAVIGEQLKADLALLNQAGIPVDVVWEQGLAAAGLQAK